MIVFKILRKIFNVPCATLFTIWTFVKVMQHTGIYELQFDIDENQLRKIRDYIYRIVNIYIRVLFNILIWVSLYVFISK